MRFCYRLSTGVIESRELERAVLEVRRRIERACAAAGRSAGEVRLVAATKGVPPAAVRAGAAVGLQDFGESYVQEMAEKRKAAPGARWHYIGRLQRNKVRRVLQDADVVHTLEPGRASERLGEVAAEAGRRIDCLVEVDFAGGRVGVAPEEAEAFVARAASLPGLRITGLTTIPPQHEDPRPYFARLRHLREELEDRVEGLRELSMGMSADIEAAVEEGATMVRVGTAIFGARPARR